VKVGLTFLPDSSLHLPLLPAGGPGPLSVHVTLDLGHDVLGALDLDREPPQVRDLDLLLELLCLSDVILLRLGLLSLSRLGAAQTRPRGELSLGPGLAGALLQGAEPVAGREGDHGGEDSLGQRLHHVTRAGGGQQRPVITEPRGLARSVRGRGARGHLAAVVLAEV